MKMMVEVFIAEEARKKMINARSKGKTCFGICHTKYSICGRK